MLLAISLFTSLTTYSQPKQDWKESGKQKLAKMDVSAIRTDHLLNLGLFSTQQLKQFRQKSKNQQGLTNLFLPELR